MGGIKYVDGTMAINKAPLLIKAGIYDRIIGEKNPEVTLTYEGFKNGETDETLLVQPQIYVAANEDSGVGEYVIYVYGAESLNYEITYENGILVITEPDSINKILVDGCLYDVYTYAGRLLGKQIGMSTIKHLPEGLYIVKSENGEVTKLLIK